MTATLLNAEQILGQSICELPRARAEFNDTVRTYFRDKLALLENDPNTSLSKDSLSLMLNYDKSELSMPFYRLQTAFRDADRDEPSDFYFDVDTVEGAHGDNNIRFSRIPSEYALP